MRIELKLDATMMFSNEWGKWDMIVIQNTNVIRPKRLHFMGIPSQVWASFLRLLAGEEVMKVYQTHSIHHQLTETRIDAIQN